MPEEKKQIIMTGVTSFVGAAAARELSPEIALPPVAAHSPGISFLFSLLR